MSNESRLKVAAYLGFMAGNYAPRKPSVDEIMDRNHKDLPSPKLKTKKFKRNKKRGY